MVSILKIKRALTKQILKVEMEQWQMTLTQETKAVISHEGIHTTVGTGPVIQSSCPVLSFAFFLLLSDGISALVNWWKERDILTCC
jgi:hypothetical protein